MSTLVSKNIEECLAKILNIYLGAEKIMLLKNVSDGHKDIWNYIKALQLKKQ